jgi:hypothetical protein
MAPNVNLNIRNWILHAWVYTYEDSYQSTCYQISQVYRWSGYKQDLHLVKLDDLYSFHPKMIVRVPNFGEIKARWPLTE